MRRPLTLLPIGGWLAFACTTYSSEDDARVVALPEAGAADAAPILTPDAGAVVAEDAGVTSRFCASDAAAGALACDDFESPEPFESRWTFTPSPMGSAKRVGDIPDRGGIASFALSDNPPGCTKHGIEQSRERAATRVIFSFLVRPTRVQDSIPPSVAYIGLEGSMGQRMEHYLQVGTFAAASYYRHNAVTERNELGQLELAKWARITVKIDLGARRIEVDRDGALVAAHQNILDLAATKRIDFGVGFPCTEGGGAFDFDDVLVKAE